MFEFRNGVFRAAVTNSPVAKLPTFATNLPPLIFKGILCRETQLQRSEFRDRYVRQILPSVGKAYHHRKHGVESQHMGTGKMTDYRAAFGAWIGHNLIHHDL